MGCCESVPEKLPQPRLKSQLSAPWPKFPSNFKDPLMHAALGNVESTISKRGEDGDIPFEYEFLLPPHEAIRYELRRAAQLLHEHFDPQNESHVQKFYAWFNDFFYPFLIEHHENEENIILPKLKEIFKKKKWVKKFSKFIPADEPCRMSVEHQTLLTRLEDVKHCRATPEALRDAFDQLAAFTKKHLAYEERFFAVIFRKIGKAECDKIESAVLEHGQKSKSKAFQLGFGSVHAAMLVWKTQTAYDALMNKIPGPVKSMFMNRWVKEYYSCIEAFASIAYVAPPPASPPPAAAPEELEEPHQDEMDEEQVVEVPEDQEQPPEEQQQPQAAAAAATEEQHPTEPVAEFTPVADDQPVAAQEGGAENAGNAPA